MNNPERAQLRIEPPAEILAATRRWLEPVRAALGHDWLAAYLTGSVLTQGFDPKHSHVNVVLVARELGAATLEALSRALPATRKPPHFAPLFITRRQIEKSLDSFPIEWLELQERHLLLEGEDVFAGLVVPRTYLRLQLEHELRGKHIQLRQAYLASARRPAELHRVLRSTASGFATLFRALLRLRGEAVPASAPQVIERVAALFGLDAQGLLGAHLTRYAARPLKVAEVLARYRGFLAEVDRLVTAIDELQTP